MENNRNTLEEGIISLYGAIHQNKDKYSNYTLSYQEARAIMAGLQLFLKEKEYRVILLRFGLNDGVRYTLLEVGMEMGITRECVRQLEARAVRKLRKSLLFGEAISRPVGPDEIDRLGLTMGTLGYLKHNNIHSVADILAMSEKDWSESRCKEAYLKEVREKVLS